MANRIMNVLRVSTLAISALMFAAAAVGCVTTEESDLETDADSSDEEASQGTGSEPGAEPQIAVCGAWGSVKCPASGKFWSYTVAGCGQTYPQANSWCNAACSVPCVNNGWYAP